MIVNKELMLINNKHNQINKIDQTSNGNGGSQCSKVCGGGGSGTPNIYIKYPQPTRLQFSRTLLTVSTIGNIINNIIYVICQNAGFYQKVIKSFLQWGYRACY